MQGLAKAGERPVTYITDTLDEDAWDSTFVNNLQMGFKVIDNQGAVVNPNLVTPGSKVTMQLSEIVPFKRPVIKDVVQSTDSAIYAVPSPTAMSLRTQMDVVLNARFNRAGDRVGLVRALRDVDIDTPADAIKYGQAERQFGSVKASFTYMNDDVVDVGFGVGDHKMRPDVAGVLPSKDLIEFSKYLVDFHVRNPHIRMSAGIASKSSNEWLMKYRMYQRVGFEVVDELGIPVKVQPPTGSDVYMLFNPDTIRVHSLAQRIADNVGLLKTAEADDDFVRLNDAVSRRDSVLAIESKLLDELLAAEGNLAEQPNLVRPAQGHEAVRSYLPLNYDAASIVTPLPKPITVYHGTRVDVPNIARLDHINGGSPSSIGVGLHVTESIGHAQLHAGKVVNSNLPSHINRPYGVPTVSKYEIPVNAAVLGFNDESMLVAQIGADVINNIDFPVTYIASEPTSVRQLLELVITNADEASQVALFQRELADALCNAGVDVIEAGPDARVILNTDILVDVQLNVPVRTMIDDAASAAAKRADALRMDYRALDTEEAYIDFADALYTSLKQDLHEVATVLVKLQVDVDRAVSQTTLWDYNGVPDPDDLPRYVPDSEPVLRSAATPFDTQTLDISPCTL
jgi:hypothetical protein